MKMVKLTIDNRQIQVPKGTTVLSAARQAGIDIPTMCYLEGYRANTSCMVCVVKVNGGGRLLPACGIKVEEGMQVESETEEVHEARRTALELLLSDHLGDCIGPCQNLCPARMNIPLMIRQIAAGAWHDAIITIKQHIALPAVLGRICPAPCEKGCRRGVRDEAVSICLLKRYAADVDLFSKNPYLPDCQPETGKNVAIVGAGPAGLAAAYYLRQAGVGCSVFDDQEKSGGRLRYGVDQKVLEPEVLDAEIGIIEKLGVRFRLKTEVGADISLKDLQKDFDAVFVAAGELDLHKAERLGLAWGRAGIEADHKTFATKIPGVFVGGAAWRPTKMAVKAAADGKNAACAIDQYLRGAAVAGRQEPFNIRMGKLKEGEIEKFMVGVSEERRLTAAPGPPAGFTEAEARREAQRCLHCDCRKSDTCKLRLYAQQYRAQATRYKGERRTFEQQRQHPEVIYEPGKCIACGICIEITSAAAEELGLSFIGRGFNVRVAVPFDESLAAALQKAAARCAAACPTGALAYNDASP